VSHVFLSPPFAFLTDSSCCSMFLTHCQNRLMSPAGWQLQHDVPLCTARNLRRAEAHPGLMLLEPLLAQPRCTLT